MIGNARRLLLWDIDHTLLSMPGVGKSWYVTALGALGVELHTYPDFRGYTERAITTEVLVSHGIEPTEENIRRVWQELITASGNARPRFAEVGYARDGAAAAIAAAAGSGAVQTVVTGNLPEISRDKVAAFGLDDHLDLEIGGYGSLSAHRPELVSTAIAAAGAKYGGQFAGPQVVVIGDTPRDVEAARHNDVRSVAVATGDYGADELAAAGADVVLGDLSDTDAVAEALLR
ncbi:HAD hydrolase-like protein [Microlunatus sp. Gsoil 973]|nr:HAD hydrolase-like protein [Microlunatus sp. Gsoil 973]